MLSGSRMTGEKVDVARSSSADIPFNLAGKAGDKNIILM